MATEQSNPPPYMSSGVFHSTIATLAEATVPNGALDRRVLDGLSGADHGALISGLKFLGYVDDDRRPTNTYRQLVEASKDPEKFKTLLLEVITEKYAPVIGNLDIKSGTISDLEKAFKAYGVPAGQMLTKTIRFYLKMLSECGVAVSPHITKAKPRNPRAANKKPAKAVQSAHTPSTPTNLHIIPKGFERMSVPGLHGAFIQYPLELSITQCDLFAAMITTLRAYAKGISGKEATE